VLQSYQQYLKDSGLIDETYMANPVEWIRNQLKKIFIAKTE